MSEPVWNMHFPVMAGEVLAAIKPMPNGLYLDGTLGLGGHAEKLLKASPDARICGLDQDAEALALARERLKRFGERVRYFQLPFSRYREALEELGWSKVNGALLDLGVSSLQLDKPERGFSFRHDGSLDMRMNADKPGKTAAALVNGATFDELRDILAIYGEEPLAGKIARAIVNARAKSPIRTTGQLAEIVSGAYPAAWRKKARNHPATRAFQALRMALNGEIGELESFLAQILENIAAQGVICIISFHSLEDRLVKNAMRGWAKGCVREPVLARCDCGNDPQVKILYKKPLMATQEEVAINPRSRSAKLRAAEKTGENSI